MEYYDDLGMCTDSFVIEPGGENVAVSIPPACGIQCMP